MSLHTCINDNLISKRMVIRNRHHVKFITAILINFLLLICIYFDLIGLKIPYLRQIIGFIYITFIQGILLIDLFRLNNLNIIEKVSYSVGLSITIVMFIGFFINTLLPYMGIETPMSVLPLICALTSTNVILIIICYKVNKPFINYSQRICFSKKPSFITQKLCFIVLPILAILGTNIFNIYGYNYIILSLIIIICIIAVIFAYKNRPELHPFAIYMISLALLFHRSLISMYLTGWDIQIEYYFSSIVIANSFYDVSINNPLNSMLSIVMLNPIYSIILNVDGIWIFKIIYPIIFSFVPLMLYHIYRTILDEKTAFFSVFLFISFYEFFTEMLGLARQQIAMFFFVLIIGVVISNNLDSFNKNILLIIFLAALVVSHYTISYIFLIYLILILFLSLLLNQQFPFSWRYISLFVALCFGWYLYTSQSETFGSFIRFGYHIYNSIYSEMLVSSFSRDDSVKYAVGQLPKLSTQRLIYAILQYIINIFIISGILIIFKGRCRIPDKTLISAIYTSFIFLILCIILPYLSTINMSRIFLITLIFLAPVCIIGGKYITNKLINVISNNTALNITYKNCINLIVFFVLIPYFLLNTGCVYELTNDPPSSISLNRDMDYIRFSEQEISAAKWLKHFKDGNLYIYADVYGVPFLGSMINPNIIMTISSPRLNNKTVYIYIRCFNIEKKQILISERDTGGKIRTRYVNTTNEYNNIYPFVETNKIYENRKAAILIY